MASGSVWPVNDGAFASVVGGGVGVLSRGSDRQGSDDDSGWGDDGHAARLRARTRARGGAATIGGGGRAAWERRGVGAGVGTGTGTGTGGGDGSDVDEDAPASKVTFAGSRQVLAQLRAQRGGITGSLYRIPHAEDKRLPPRSSRQTGYSASAMDSGGDGDGDGDRGAVQSGRGRGRRRSGGGGATGGEGGDGEASNAGSVGSMTQSSTYFLMYSASDAHADPRTTRTMTYEKLDAILNFDGSVGGAGEIADDQSLCRDLAALARGFHHCREVLQMQEVSVVVASFYNCVVATPERIATHGLHHITPDNVLGYLQLSPRTELMLAKFKQYVNNIVTLTEQRLWQIARGDDPVPTGAISTHLQYMRQGTAILREIEKLRRDEAKHGPTEVGGPSPDDESLYALLGRMRAPTAGAGDPLRDDQGQGSERDGDSLAHALRRALQTSVVSSPPHTGSRGEGSGQARPRHRHRHRHRRRRTSPSGSRSRSRGTSVASEYNSADSGMSDGSSPKRPRVYSESGSSGESEGSAWEHADGDMELDAFVQSAAGDGDGDGGGASE